jgi:hypothetical protein
VSKDTPKPIRLEATNISAADDTVIDRPAFDWGHCYMCEWQGPLTACEPDTETEGSATYTIYHCPGCDAFGSIECDISPAAWDEYEKEHPPALDSPAADNDKEATP